MTNLEAAASISGIIGGVAGVAGAIAAIYQANVAKAEATKASGSAGESRKYRDELLRDKDRKTAVLLYERAEAARTICQKLQRPATEMGPPRGINVGDAIASLQDFAEQLGRHNNAFPNRDLNIYSASLNAALEQFRQEAQWEAKYVAMAEYWQSLRIALRKLEEIEREQIGNVLNAM